MAGAAPPARLWASAPTARRWLTASIALGVLAAVAWAGVLVGIARIVAAVFLGGASGDAITPALLCVAALVIARSALVALAGGASQTAASLVTAAERHRLADLLRARHPVVALGDRSGELVHLVTTDVDRLDGYVARYLPARTLAVVVPLLLTTIIGVIDPLTLPILLFTGPLLVITLALIGRTTQARTLQRERELTWMDGHFLDMVRGLPTLRLFGRADEQAETIEGVARRLASSSLDVLRTAFQTSLVLEWGATAATALVAITVSVRLMAGDVSFERALAVLLLTPECFVPVRQLASHYHVGAAGRVALDALARIEAEPAEGMSLGAPAPIPAAAAVVLGPPTIRVRDLLVTYDGREQPVLDGATFTLEARRLTVLAGATGAGKSTLAAAILRLVEPDGGRVEVDGVDIATLDVAAWRRSVAWSPQHPHLFDGTIADALRLGRPGATDAEIRAAAQAAAIDAVVAALPEGYDTRLGESGARLSGGEIARLALARAFLRRAPVLIVDEPTANLDASTAERVRASLRGASVTSTVLAISHDPELAAVADRLLVVDRGRVRRATVPTSGRRPRPTPVAWVPPSRRGPVVDGR